MPEKTEFEKWCDSVELMSDDEVETSYNGHVAQMNAHSNAAQDHRTRWLFLRDEQKRRMRK